jgi:hypothetical protein
MAKELSPEKQIDKIIASQPNWKGERLEQLRAVILSASKDITEEVKWKMPSKPLGSPTWEADGIVCVADFLKNAVRLTFPKGAQLADPKNLFNSRLDSKTVRAIDFYENEKLNIAALKALIKAGVSANKN